MQDSTRKNRREPSGTKADTLRRLQIPPEVSIELSPTIDSAEPWRPAFERLKRLLWPSVSSEVDSLLQRACDLFMAKRFRIHELLNSCGDGKSWELVVDPPPVVPEGMDAFSLAAKCQAEIVISAPRPIWEGEHIIVPLWRSGPSVSRATSTNESEASRESVKRLMDQKGWSPLDLAKEADVDHHTVMNYLRGKTKKLYPSTRKKLADALGISVQNFPN